MPILGHAWEMEREAKNTKNAIENHALIEKAVPRFRLKSEAERFVSKPFVLSLLMGANDCGQYVYNTDAKFCGKAILKKMEEARNQLFLRNNRFSADKRLFYWFSAIWHYPIISGRGKII